MYGISDDGRIYKTNFYDLGKKNDKGEWIKKPTPIDWEILKNSVMTGYPVINYRSSWANDGKLSIQTQLSSFIVTSIKKREYTIIQQVHVEELVASHPDMQEKSDNEIAELAGMLSLTAPPDASGSNTQGSYDPKTDDSQELGDAQGLTTPGITPSPHPSSSIATSPSSAVPPSQTQGTVNLPSTPTQANNLQQFMNTQQAAPATPIVPVATPMTPAPTVAPVAGAPAPVAVVPAPVQVAAPVVAAPVMPNFAQQGAPAPANFVVPHFPPSTGQP